MNPLYDKKDITKYLIVVCAAIALWKVTMGFGAILTAVLSIIALTRKKRVDFLLWVLFMTFSACGNRNIFAVTIVSVLTVRIALMLLAAMLFTRSIKSDGGLRMAASFWWVMPYIFWECMISAQGFQPTISYLKLLLFVSIYSALIGMVSVVSTAEVQDEMRVRSVVLTFATFLLIGSVAIIPLPSLSYMSGEDALAMMLAGETVSLFQGITAHSQAMGVIAGMFGTFLFADLAFNLKKWDKFYVLLLLTCLVLIYKSSSRTGMGTLVAGMGMVAFIAMQGKGLGGNWRGRFMMIVNAMVVMCVIMILAVPSMRNKIAAYTLKWDTSGRTDLTIDEVMSSRQGAIDIAMDNFRKKPLTGNGFQVSEEMSYASYEGLASYLSAPVEKGVWVFAVLEEGGAIGLFLISIGLLVVLVTLIKRGAYLCSSVFFAFIVSNLGEFSMFSMTYSGGFFWAFVFACLCLDIFKIRRERIGGAIGWTGY